MDHSSRPMPPLETLHAFEVAARSGSFSAAAEKLNLTHGAVSRQIAKLEAWLGLKVFDRGARGVALTIEGQRLFLRTSEAFALIADNTDRWVEPRGAAVVRLASIPSICGLWLIPRLTALEGGNAAAAHRARGRHPPDRPRRRRHRSFDALRAWRHRRPHLGAAVRGALLPDRLAGTRRKRSAAARPERLLKYPLIHDSDASGWRAWLGAHGIDYRPRPQDRRFEDYNLVLDAAANGLGIALARPPLTEQKLAAGRLVAGRQAHRAQPGLLLARPAARALRPAAAELATTDRRGSGSRHRQARRVPARRAMRPKAVRQPLAR